MREATGNLASTGGATKVNRHEDLSPGRMRQRSHDDVERRQLLRCIDGQSGSTSQMVSSSSTGPIGSQIAMISGD